MYTLGVKLRYLHDKYFTDHNPILPATTPFDFGLKTLRMEKKNEECPSYFNTATGKAAAG